MVQRQTSATAPGERLVVPVLPRLSFGRQRGSGPLPGLGFAFFGVPVSRQPHCHSWADAPVLWLLGTRRPFGTRLTTRLLSKTVFVLTSRTESGTSMTASASFLLSRTVGSSSRAPLSVHAYAPYILAGTAVAVWITSRRWTARGGAPGQVLNICLWAVPAGIPRGRIHYVITDRDLYFLPRKNPWNA
ncbi:prolipoprotein diacylglyceryl transferase [Arthrobacter sp. Hiyo8]|nr:prolipoprotein diacylglyceryl transferase [Arthrobacter sp. Hiyo8]